MSVWARRGIYYKEWKNPSPKMHFSHAIQAVGLCTRHYYIGRTKTGNRAGRQFRNGTALVASTFGSVFLLFSGSTCQNFFYSWDFSMSLRGRCQQKSMFGVPVACYQAILWKIGQISNTKFGGKLSPQQKVVVRNDLYS